MKNHAFTLIELVVVVLIIGILAAIALPQYQKAVIKARASTIFPVLDLLVKGQEVYYLANGTGTTDARQLDIDMPGNCSLATDDNDNGTQWSCGTDFYVGLGEDLAWAVYCPGYSSSLESCVTAMYIQLGWGTSFASSNARYAPNSRRCWMPGGANEKGESICKALGVPVECGGDKFCYEIR